MSAGEGLLDRAFEGCGTLVHLLGLADIAESRPAHESVAMACNGDVEVLSRHCKLHSEIPAFAVAGLGQATTGVAGLDPDAADGQESAWVCCAEADVKMRYEGVRSIADPGVAFPEIGQETRRRPTALVNASLLARETPTCYIVRPEKGTS